MRMFKRKRPAFVAARMHAGQAGTSSDGVGCKTGAAGGPIDPTPQPHNEAAPGSITTTGSKCPTRFACFAALPARP